MIITEQQKSNINYPLLMKSKNGNVFYVISRYKCICLIANDGGFICGQECSVIDSHKLEVYNGEIILKNK